MVNGIPYDSKKALSICGVITAIMHMTLCDHGNGKGTRAFEGYEENGESMMWVIRNHRRAAFRSRTVNTKVEHHASGN